MGESNPAAKRNAFLFLFNCDQKRAINYLNSIMSSVNLLGESFQLVVLELIRKVSRQTPQIKSHYIRCIHALISSSSHPVAFEAANTLVVLSSAPTAIRASVGAYCALLKAESDNNVKLIVLSRLVALKKRHASVLSEVERTSAPHRAVQCSVRAVPSPGSRYYFWLRCTSHLCLAACPACL